MSSVKNTELFETTPVPKALRTMMLPTIMGQLIILIYNMADTFFIGRTDNPYMVAAASLVLPVFNISIAISNLTSVGSSALISRLLGASREDEARRVSSFCIYCTLFAAAIFSLIILVFMRPVLRLLGAGDNTFEYARTYALCVIVFGAIPTIFTSVLANLVRSVGESAKAGFGVTLGGVINIILDPIFMFVLLPDGYEIAGAGIATCLSNCISCTYFIISVRKLTKRSVLGLLPIKDLPEKSSIASIFSVGTPSCISSFLFDIDYMVVDKLMSSYSDIALAAVGIVLKAERLPLNVGQGICHGMVPLIAYNYSSKDFKRMNLISKQALKVGITVAVISIALYEAFAPYIIRFFIKDALTVELGARFLRIRTVATLFMFMSFYHVFLFNGYGRGEYSLLLAIVRWAVFNIPMLFLLNALIGMYGIVWSQLISDILTVILSVYVHHRFKKENALLT